jgi:hypothetical protein
VSVRSYTTSILVNEDPSQVFETIKNVHGWWSEDIEGRAEQVGEIFTHSFMDVHRCKIIVTELEPNTRIVWKVLDNYFSFTQEQAEWIGTEIVFEIARRADKTEVNFMHLGLVPDFECYEICTAAWDTLITVNLRDHIAIDRGMRDALTIVSAPTSRSR